MKQVVIRLVAPGVNVYDVSYGEIVDGQFRPVDIETAPSVVLHYVVRSSILGSQAYLPKKGLAFLLKDLDDDILENIELYVNFIVITLKNNDDDEEPKEEKDA